MLEGFPSDENSFVNNFQTARDEANYINEQNQTKLLLRLLEEMDNYDGTKGYGNRKELLRISEHGDIVRDEPHEPRKAQKQFMGIDDLPKETLDDMLFGKPQEEDPLFRVESGRRLKDGKSMQRVNIADDLEFSLPFKIEGLLTFCLLALCLFLLVKRLFFPSRQATMKFEDIDHLIAVKVNERVNERLNSILLNSFMRT